MGGPESRDNSALSDEQSVNCEAEQKIAQSEALPAKHDTVHNISGAVDYKPCTVRELQIDEHVRRKQDATAQLKKNLSKELAISPQYHASKKPFIEILSHFQPIRDGHFSRINIAKHRIKRHLSDKAPVHSAVYSACPKTRVLHNPKIDKMLAENIIEPERTEWAAPIVFVLKKNRTLRFCVKYGKLNAVTN